MWCRYLWHDHHTDTDTIDPTVRPRLVPRATPTRWNLSGLRMANRLGINRRDDLIDDARTRLPCLNAKEPPDGPAGDQVGGLYLSAGSGGGLGDQDVPGSGNHRGDKHYHDNGQHVIDCSRVHDKANPARTIRAKASMPSENHSARMSKSSITESPRTSRAPRRGCRCRSAPNRGRSAPPTVSNC